MRGKAVKGGACSDACSFTHGGGQNIPAFCLHWRRTNFTAREHGAVTHPQQPAWLIVFFRWY
jgi:hypothetical protein